MKNDLIKTVSKKRRLLIITWDRPFSPSRLEIESFPLALPGVVGRSLPSLDGLPEDIFISLHLNPQLQQH